MKHNGVLFSILCYLLIFPVAFDLSAESSACLDCHSDDSITMDRKGKEISLFLDEIKFSASVHGDLECTDCHVDFDPDVLPHRSGANIARVNCADCHEDYAELEKTDIHHRLIKRVGKKAPDCQRCHGTHAIKAPDNSPNKVNQYCSDCHDNIILANPFHTKSVPSSVCFDCHDTNEQNSQLAKSIHNDLACADCHNFISHNLSEHPDNIPHSQVADCYLCHKNIALEHRESIHGISLNEGIGEAAQCWNCHGSHAIIKAKSPESPVTPANLAKTCGKCHDDPKLVEKFAMSVKSPGKLYSLSVHGQLVMDGNGKAANCSTCHGIHDIKNRVQQGSKISSFNVPATCDKCHAEIVEEYEQSIHWIQAKKGIRNAPVCNDCHSEHSIEAINTKNKKSEVRKIQEKTCFNCHQNPILAKRYSLSGGETSKYKDSYHGLAGMRGDEEVALCIDCHGVHKILPRNAPGSQVNVANVTKTCQKCHTDATETFAKSYSHITESVSAQRIESIVRKIYFWIIVIVIGGMLLHNILILIHEVKKKRARSKGEIAIPRFTPDEVVQHIILFTSFIILAITGFALKYPASWWAEGLMTFGMSETIRQNTHRTAAVVMIVLGVYHVVYLVLTRRGRDVLKCLLPRLDDLKQAWQNIMFYLHISDSKPEFDQYDYTEKAEYWALIWGTVVMGLTGFVLWVPTIVGDWAPVWLIKVSETVHFYEAILASLAIVVWHWFFVMFHPRAYPMSFTWIDGKMSLGSYRHHHERKFKKILLEWFTAKTGSADGKPLSHFAGLVTSTLVKNGLDPDEVFREELRHDPKLMKWFEDEFGGLPEK